MIHEKKIAAESTGEPRVGSILRQRRVMSLAELRRVSGCEGAVVQRALDRLVNAGYAESVMPVRNPNDSGCDADLVFFRWLELEETPGPVNFQGNRAWDGWKHRVFRWFHESTGGVWNSILMAR